MSATTLYWMSWVVSIAAFLIDVVIAVMVGIAARRKDRSFASFFWLSLLLAAVIPALIVAALPFRDDDPRHPQNKRR